MIDTAARWMMLGEWRAHPARVAVAALAIAIGVALGLAVHIVNQSALGSFAKALASVNGAADLQVHSTSPTGFDEALYPRLARLPGVAAASPVVELVAGNNGTKLTLIGLDILRAVKVTPALVASAGIGSPIAGGQNPFATDALALSPAALADSGRKVGDHITVTAVGRSVDFTIASVLAGDNEAIAVADIAAVQWRLGQIGRLQRVDLKLAEDADAAAVGGAITAMLPADAQLVTPRSEANRTDSLSRAYRVNLEMLAMMALLTGGFLVYSAQSLSVARRRPQFALLRVLGLKRGRLLRQMVLEGGIVGIIGAVMGLAMGIGLASLAVDRLGGDLGGGYFRGSHPELMLSPGAALVFMGLGIAVAMGGSLMPALEAARAQPAVALKTMGDSSDPTHRPLAWPGLALLGLGAIAALAPPVLELPLFGYAAMALMLAGGVLAMPWLARTLLAPLQSVAAGPALGLALKRLWGAPGQAAVALCGIVASTSLMVAMAVMVTSFRGSVDDWLVQILPSDLYLHIEGAEAGGLDTNIQARLAATPGVSSIRFVRSLPLRLSPERPPIALTAQPLDRRNPDSHLPLLRPSLAAPPGEIPVWVSEPMVWLYGKHAGERMTLPLGDRARPVFIAGVWRDYARQFGAITMASADFTALTGDATRSEAAIDVVPGTPLPALTSALRQRLPAGIARQAQFAEPRQMRVMALALFDRSFAVTYALEAIAIGIGLAGVAATFSAQTLARRREFGMLRHIGVSRRQVTAMLAAEGALLGAIGGIAGIALGVVMSQVLIHVVNPQSFHWTMDTRLPWALFAALLAALVVAAAGTAVLAGRRALSADAVRAVREDW